jgi:hypothetical protein
VSIWVPALRSNATGRCCASPGERCTASGTRAAARRMGGAKRYPSIAFIEMMGFAKRSTHRATLHGVVFDILVGSENRDKTTRRANHQKSVQPPLQKYFAFAVGQIISTDSCHPTPQEGRIMIVTTRGVECGGRGSVLRATGLQGGFM